MLNAQDLPVGWTAGLIYKEAIEKSDRVTEHFVECLRRDRRNRMLEDLDLIEYEPEPEN